MSARIIDWTEQTLFGMHGYTPEFYKLFKHSIPTILHISKFAAFTSSLAQTNQTFLDAGWALVEHVRFTASCAQRTLRNECWPSFSCV